MWSGRDTRSRWWLWQLVAGVVFVAVTMPGLAMVEEPGSGAGFAVLCLGLVLAGLVSLASSVRRAHDLGRSAVFVLAWSLVPVVGGLVLLVRLGFEGSRT